MEFFRVSRKESVALPQKMGMFPPIWREISSLLFLTLFNNETKKLPRLLHYYYYMNYRTLEEKKLTKIDTCCKKSVLLMKFSATTSNPPDRWYKTDEKSQILPSSLLIAAETVEMELMKDNELSNFYKKTSILITGGNGVRKQ
jgi:hypothetical protein